MYFLINALKWFANPAVRKIDFDMCSLAAGVVPLQVFQLPRKVSSIQPESEGDMVGNFKYQMANLLSKVCGMAGVNRGEVEQVYLKILKKFI